MPPFVGRRYRYRRDRHAAKAIGPQLMATEAWQADPLRRTLTVISRASSTKRSDCTSGSTTSRSTSRHCRFDAISRSASSRSGWIVAARSKRGHAISDPKRRLSGSTSTHGVPRFDDPANHRHVRIGSQDDSSFLSSIVREFGQFDVILDDGSHRPSHMNASFRHLFDQGLAAGGLYLAEDLQNELLVRLSRCSGLLRRSCQRSRRRASRPVPGRFR